MLWYPELIDSVGWERGEFITVDSFIAQATSYLVVSFVLWVLYILGFWLLLRILSGGNRQYQKDHREVVGGIIIDS